MKKISKLFMLGLSSLSLISCGNNETAPAASLSGRYVSTAKMTYQNNRPQFNYYLTTFDFQTLDTYSDNTYQLTFISSTFSAVILPENGNAATANERENYTRTYYGTFTKTLDDLDEDTVHYALSEPTRIVLGYDGSYYVDTDNWTENMTKKSVDQTVKYDTTTGKQTVTGTTEYKTGAEYLAAKKFTGPLNVSVTESLSLLEYVTLK